MATEVKDTSSDIEMSTDIYKIAEFVESIKAKYIDIPEETLALGVYGFLSSMFTNLIENTTTMAAEYAYEAIPSKAKFERNIIGHALSFGIDKVFATPAELDIILGIPEESLNNLMVNNEYILDKETIFNIASNKTYPYLLDYGITIKRNLSYSENSYRYTAQYNIDGTNALATMINPYLPAIEITNIDGTNVLLLKTTIKQMSHSIISRKILVDNPLENKVLTFEFTNQLAFFYVEVEEDGTSYYLKPIYDGLSEIYMNNDTEYYINYIFLDSKNIRLTFNRESYQPRRNVNVNIHVYTTLGAEANFRIQGYQTVQNLGDGLSILIQNLGDSEYGSDRLNIKQLKAAIPKEMVSKGVVTTYQDLNNLFNSIQTENCKLYFLEKLHNQLNRVFYSYILLKDDSMVIPTNTIDVTINGAAISSSTGNAYLIKPGSIYYTDPNTKESIGMAALTDEQISEYDKKGFLYTCPYLMVINKSPMYVGYYLTLIDYSRYLYFEYINKDSQTQFISLDFHTYRDYYVDPDVYKIDVKLTQTVSTDYNLVTYVDENTVEATHLRVFMVIYSTNSDGEEVPTRYAEAELIDFQDGEFAFTYQFKFVTDDQISNNNYLIITHGLKNIGTNVESFYNIPSNVKIKLFYLTLEDTPAQGRLYGDNLQYNLDNLIPGLSGYTLTNVYNAGDAGMDIYYDYSDINYSYIEINQDSADISMNIKRIPVVRYTYLINSNYPSRIKNFLYKMDVRKRYIETKLERLENSFGIDYKFFNTYGPSYMYNINNQANIDRINLSLKFEIKFQIPSEKTFIPMIINSIKEYIEDLNYITDLHIPNLITHITNLYREHLIYIKFIKLNNYGSLYQSIYKNPTIDKDYFEETQTVPEFININTISDTNLPDIEFKIVE